MENKEVAVSKTQALANETGFNRQQIELMKDTIAKGATDDELAFFLQVATRGGLDPFSRQIYMIKRFSGGKEQMTVQMGIDGFRATAQSTGEYAGSDDTEFGPEVESEYTDYNNKKMTFTHPEWAKVNVWGKGDARPTAVTVRWKEFYPGDKQGTMWRKMPYQMLGKVAEAQSLRKRFPKALSGVYASEEMEQANENPKQVQEQEEKQEKVVLNENGDALASESQVKIMYIRATEKGYDREYVHKIMGHKFNKTSGKDLTRDEAVAMIEGFDKAPYAKDLNRTRVEVEDPEVQAALDDLGAEVVADGVPVQKKVKLTPEESDAADAEIAKYKNQGAE